MTYIEREALLKELNEYRSNLLRVYATINEEKDKLCCCSELGGLAAVIREVQQMPAADVAPVRRGLWELGKSGAIYFCDNCSNFAFPREVREWNYCPICGQKNVMED